MAFNLHDLQKVFQDPEFQAEMARYSQSEREKGYFFPRLQSPRHSSFSIPYPGILDAEFVYEDILDAEFIDPDLMRLID